jgi:NAD(P)-dependent dehydrogenase (short-subunit alcohol dehydrogenase family)
MDSTDLQVALAVAFAVTSAAGALFFEQRRKQRQRRQANLFKSKVSSIESARSSIPTFDAVLQYAPAHILAAEIPLHPLVGADTPFLRLQYQERETITLPLALPSLGTPSSTAPTARPKTADRKKTGRGTLWITGAGSGLGMESALYLASRGFRVFGSVLTDAEADDLRSAAEERQVSLDILHADVTRPYEIECAVERIVEEAGTIDGLIQFAGMGLRGFFEDLSLDEIREVFDVNLFGMMAVTRAVLPIMREARKGRIILTSSVGGRMGSMSIGGYASSKFAVEGFGECLRQEMAPFNVQVSLLEPGMILTPHFTVNRNLARRAMDPASPYYAWFHRHESIVDGFLARNTFGPPEVAKTVFQILTSRHPRLRYLVGGKAKLVINLRRYLPGEWFERVYWAVVRRMVTRSS